MANRDNDRTYSEEEIFNMMNDTSRVFAQRDASVIGGSIDAFGVSSKIADEVEFYAWMDRNFTNCGAFSSPSNMKAYVAEKENYLRNTLLKGKGYEWDNMQFKRFDPKNIANQYYLGDDPVRPGTDLTETNLFTGKQHEYQMKAYTSQLPNNKNTPKDATVVTNAENVEGVRAEGFQTEAYKNSKTIQKDVDRRISRMKSGDANPAYSLKNVGTAMGKAGMIGCVIGMGTEAIISYEAWKAGEMTDDEYAIEILKAGAESGISSAATAGIMIPIAATITAAGLTGLVTIPISFVFGAVINKIVAPCFGRGDYKVIMNEVHYYQNLETLYGKMTIEISNALRQYDQLLERLYEQDEIYQGLVQRDADSKKRLEDVVQSLKEKG